MPYTIRSATPGDEQALAKLLPLLADFSIPNNRDPKDLWHGDYALLKKSLAGKAGNTSILLATDATDNAIAMAMVTLKPDILSGAPGAHLEALAVHPDHTRQGLARQLITACTEAAKQQGATYMSLNVFSNNKKARALYQACDFDEELIRCYKTLQESELFTR